MKKEIREQANILFQFNKECATQEGEETATPWYFCMPKNDIFIYKGNRYFVCFDLDWSDDKKQKVSWTITVEQRTEQGTLVIK